MENLLARLGGEQATPVTAGNRWIGRYEVIGELASGGMGVVYQAEDRQMNRRVALKMIRGGIFAGAEEVKRFHREARALAQLNHPHIIQVYDFGEVDSRPYFTMQLVTGGSLAGHMTRFGGDERTVVALIEKVAWAVQHAHERGILHRDLKPANVLLGDGDEPVVSDFGLVKFLHAEAEGLTQTGLTPGTPAYMAPEQAAGRNQAISPRTDVWALGVILYELLCGRRPFTGDSREAMLHHILTKPVPAPCTRRPDIDPVLEAVVLKCLAKEPGDRYATAGDLADDLGRWLRGELRAPKGATLTRLASSRHRRLLRTALRTWNQRPTACTCGRQSLPDYNSWNPLRGSRIASKPACAMKPPIEAPSESTSVTSAARLRWGHVTWCMTRTLLTKDP
jgi:serine/threonine-protein kinase